MRDIELEKFKSGIDLRSFAAAFGYRPDQRESWRGSTVMRHRNGDKIIVSRDRRGHFVYFSIRDERDHGSILDFVMNRNACSLGEARRSLRAWMGAAPPPLLYRFSELAVPTPDPDGVRRRFREMADAARHPYLENERRISPALLSSPRMRGRIKMDRSGNAIFPHFNEGGLCGYEIKNRGFTSFSRGGRKGLWLSNEIEGDSTIVVAESAIDALSYCQLFRDASARYASVGGQMSPRQPGLLIAAVARMPKGSMVVAAMDADEQGRRLADRIFGILKGSRLSVDFRAHPPEAIKDWNDVLRLKPG